jgi:hypothetical protein
VFVVGVRVCGVCAIHAHEEQSSQNKSKQRPIFTCHDEIDNKKELPGIALTLQYGTYNTNQRRDDNKVKG